MGGRRERRLNSSKIIVLAGADLEKIVEVFYDNFLIYIKKSHTRSTFFSIYWIISLSVISLFLKLVFCMLLFIRMC